MSFRFPPYTAAKEKKMQLLAVPKIPYPRPGSKTPFNWALWGSLFAVAGAGVALIRRGAIGST